MDRSSGGGKRNGGASAADKPALLERFRAQMLATARRYSLEPHDADDAFQRAAEILLTHSPTGTDDELCRWLRTTVKHEALAIRRQRERTDPTGEPERLPAPPGCEQPDAYEHVERRERARVGAQALARLKPQEIRCLLLKAEGYSYREICEITCWTYTKVNRCLTEGRKAFIERVRGIESGAECERLAPSLSALADGELPERDVAHIRSHVSGCASCRALLRGYRAVPSKVAALAPALPLAAVPEQGPLRGVLESLSGSVQHKAALIGDRYQQAVEMIAGQKTAATAACCAAALAGGGAVTAERIAPLAPSSPPEIAADQIRKPAPPEPSTATGLVTPPLPTAPIPSPTTAPAQSSPPAPAPQPPPPPPAPPPTPVNEFAPQASAATGGSTSAPAASVAPRRGRNGGEFAP